MMSYILIDEDDITFGMMLKTWLGKKGFYNSRDYPSTKVSICLNGLMNKAWTFL